MSVWGQRSVVVFWGCVLLAVVCCPVVVIVHLYILLGLGWRVLSLFYWHWVLIYSKSVPASTRLEDPSRKGTTRTAKSAPFNPCPSREGPYSFICRSSCLLLVFNPDTLSCQSRHHQLSIRTPSVVNPDKISCQSSHPQLLWMLPDLKHWYLCPKSEGVR